MFIECVCERVFVDCVSEKVSDRMLKRMCELKGEQERISYRKIL